jgi:outer membrane protein
VHGRVLGGAFLNYYLAPQWRLVSSVLAGGGDTGVLANVAIQHLSGNFSAAHRLTVSAGLELADRNYNSTFFGVTAAEHLRSGNAQYAPGGGVKDVYVAARWNWALSPSWILSTTARAARLQGDARTSPLVERPNQYSISTGLARRF